MPNLQNLALPLMLGLTNVCLALGGMMAQTMWGSAQPITGFMGFV